MAEDSISKGTEVYEVICTPGGGGLPHWNDTTVKLLLSQFPVMIEKLKSREITSKKQMYQLISSVMRNHGHTFSYLQIENKWKTLLRSYKNSLKKTKFGLVAGKGHCIYQEEIKQILEKMDISESEMDNDMVEESSCTGLETADYIEFDCNGEEPVAKRICNREAQEYSTIAAQIVASEMGLNKNSQSSETSTPLPRSGYLHSKQEHKVAEQLILLRRDLRQMHEKNGRNMDSQIVDQLYLLREDIRRTQEDIERNSAKRHREMLQVLNNIASTLKAVHCNQAVSEINNAT